ncbi:hypothetical protein [Streptomyces sp. NPDC003299]
MIIGEVEVRGGFPAEYDGPGPVRGEAGRSWPRPQGRRAGVPAPGEALAA